MKKIDKNTKKLIIMVSIINLVIGTLLSSSISYAIQGYSSREVSYSPNNSNWKVSNVDDALTSLYAMAGAQGVLPVGTINSIMGKTAPENFLKYDGTVYNIKDYPELAKYFKNQFGSSNYFGGDGTTTFAVPDLRGEFLRGTGTNNKTGLSGLAVGVHQDPTLIPRVIADQDRLEYVSANTSNDGKGDARNYDSTFNSTATRQYRLQNTSTVWEASTAATTHYSARPTNTSVLYVIATKDIYVEGKVNYSTEERVIGTWIDGKPLYQKVYKTKAPDTANSNLAVQSISDIPFDMIFIAGGFLDIDGYSYELNTVIGSQTDSSSAWVRKQEKTLAMNVSTGRVNKDVYIIVQYTKTTD